MVIPEIPDRPPVWIARILLPVLKGAELLKTEIEENSGSNLFEFHAGYHFGGYAKTDEELLTFIKKFSSSCGILIEPVYTGKMFFLCLI